MLTGLLPALLLAQTWTPGGNLAADGGVSARLFCAVGQQDCSTPSASNWSFAVPVQLPNQTTQWACAGTNAGELIADGGVLYYCDGGAWAAVATGSGGTITGSGASPEVAVWSGSSALTGYAGFTSDSLGNVAVNSLVLPSDAGIFGTIGNDVTIANKDGNTVFDFNTQNNYSSGTTLYLTPTSVYGAFPSKFQVSSGVRQVDGGGYNEAVAIGQRGSSDFGGLDVGSLSGQYGWLGTSADFGFYSPVWNTADSPAAGSTTTNLALGYNIIGGTGWTLLNATAPTTNGRAPDFTTTAVTLQDNSANGAHIAYQAITYGSGTYQLSVYAKAGTGQYACLWGDSNTSTSFASYDLAHGIVAATGGAKLLSASTLFIGNYQWLQITYTGTNNASSFAIGTGNSSGCIYAGTGTNNIFWGAQLIQNANSPPLPTPIVPTAGATLTWPTPTEWAFLAQFSGLNVGYTGINSLGPISLDGVGYTQISDSANSGTPQATVTLTTKWGDGGIDLDSDGGVHAAACGSSGIVASLNDPASPSACIAGTFGSNGTAILESNVGNKGSAADTIVRNDGSGRVVVAVDGGSGTDDYYYSPGNVGAGLHVTYGSVASTTSNEPISTIVSFNGATPPAFPIIEQLGIASVAGGSATVNFGQAFNETGASSTVLCTCGEEANSLVSQDVACAAGTTNVVIKTGATTINVVWDCKGAL